MALSIDSEFRRLAKEFHPDKGRTDEGPFKDLSSIRAKFDTVRHQKEANDSRNNATISSLTARQAQHAGELQDAKRALAEATHQWRHWCGRAQAAECGLQRSQAEASAAKWWHERCMIEERGARKMKDRAADLEGRLCAADEDARGAEEREKAAVEERIKAQSEAQHWADRAEEAQEDARFWGNRAEELRKARDDDRLAAQARAKALEARLRAHHAGRPERKEPRPAWHSQRSVTLTPKPPKENEERRFWLEEGPASRPRQRRGSPPMRGRSPRRHGWSYEHPAPKLRRRGSPPARSRSPRHRHGAQGGWR